MISLLFTPFCLLSLRHGVSFCIDGEATLARVSGTVKKAYKLGLQFDRSAKNKDGFGGCVLCSRKTALLKSLAYQGFRRTQLFILIYSKLSPMASRLQYTYSNESKTAGG